MDSNRTTWHWQQLPPFQDAVSVRLRDILPSGEPLCWLATWRATRQTAIACFAVAGVTGNSFPTYVMWRTLLLRWNRGTAAHLLPTTACYETPLPGGEHRGEGRDAGANARLPPPNSACCGCPMFTITRGRARRSALPLPTLHTHTHTGGRYLPVLLVAKRHSGGRAAPCCRQCSSTPVSMFVMPAVWTVNCGTRAAPDAYLPRTALPRQPLPPWLPCCLRPLFHHCLLHHTTVGAYTKYRRACAGERACDGTQAHCVGAGRPTGHCVLRCTGERSRTRRSLRQAVCALDNFTFHSRLACTAPHGTRTRPHPLRYLPHPPR